MNAPEITLERSEIYWYVAGFYYTCSFFELLLVIFYFNQFIKKNSAYTSVYYVLLTTGYLISFLFQFAWLLFDLFKHYSIIFKYIAYLTDWYFLFFIGFWNFVVGLYRCTAVGLPIKHQKIWRGKQIPSVILVLIFPFLINGYTLSNPYCKTHYYDPPCYAQTLEISNLTFIVNICLTFLTLALVILAYVASRIYGSQSLTATIECRLIFQAILSTIFQLIYYTFNLLNPISLLFDENFTLAISLVAFMFQHYSNIIVLFVVSKSFRHDLMTFYRLGFLFKKPTEKFHLVMVYTATLENNNKAIKY